MCVLKALEKLCCVTFKRHISKGFASCCALPLALMVGGGGGVGGLEEEGDEDGGEEKKDGEVMGDLLFSFRSFLAFSCSPPSTSSMPSPLSSPSAPLLVAKIIPVRRSDKGEEENEEEKKIGGGGGGAGEGAGRRRGG